MEDAHEDPPDLFAVLLGADGVEPEPEPREQGEDGAEREPRRRRPVLVGLAVGLGVGLGAVAIAFSIVAIPMYTLASFEPGQGLQRNTVRTGLLVVALPFGVLVGLVTGTAVGIWKARGGHLPRDRTPIHG